MNSLTKLIAAGMVLFAATACTQTPKNMEKAEIDEITHLVENWSYHKNPTLTEVNACEIFTERLIEDYERVDSMHIALGDEVGLLDFDPWSESQDPNPKTKGIVNEVYDITDSTATVEMIITRWNDQIAKTLYLKYTEDGWRIDDMTIGEGVTLRTLF